MFTTFGRVKVKVCLRGPILHLAVLGSFYGFATLKIMSPIDPELSTAIPPPKPYTHS